MAMDPEQPRPKDADLKETEDLLAGFDRPARKPGTPHSPNRDFVDFHIEKRRGGVTPARPPVIVERPPDARRNMPTALMTVKKTKPTPWWVWAAGLALMTSAGVLVTALAFRVGPSTPTTTPSAPAPTETHSAGPSSVASELATPTPTPTTPLVPEPSPIASTNADAPAPSAPVKKLHAAPQPPTPPTTQQPPSSKSAAPAQGQKPNGDIDLIRNL